ncbi:ABC transporter substrate-binding protein [Variovorax sp. OV329]|uniref:ABC transporter substrate-binding protein n=1 Tax=Variovorax sp. OV329 TaxID=1882825 RepID=UPI0008EF864E|nr:ABC transporter substrate-binding protein [Variovorax sp. OV329]SFM92465.1 peptide/nickel transport system substrate-binding protein [Variovorax sp. OV329]
MNLQGVQRRRALKAAAAVSVSIGAGWPISGFTSEQPQRGGNVTYLSGRMPGVLVPAIEATTGVSMIGAKILEPLFILDYAGKLVPMLGLSFAASDAGQTFTVRLRPGVKWHDGQPFTSADVAYSMTSVWKIFVTNQAFDLVKTIDTPAADTVVFRLERPISPDFFRATLASPFVTVVPRHLYEGKDVRTNPVNARPIGTGPFKITQRVENRYIVLERNPEYWQPQLPYLDRLTLQIMPDDSAAAAALEANQAQLVPQSNISIGDAKRLADSPTVAITTKGNEGLGWFGTMLFNLSTPGLSDLRVRRAIAHAIDRQVIADSAFAGFAKAAASIYPRDAHFFTKEGVPAYAVDLPKAKALLADAGYGPGKKPLKLKLAFLPFNQGLVSGAEYIQQALSGIGIEVELIQRDSAGSIRNIYRDYNFDLAVTLATATADPAQSVSNYFWSKTIDKIPFHNASQYRSAEADSAIERLASEQDNARRVQVAAELQRIIMRDLPALPLVEMQYYQAYRRELQNVANTPTWVLGSWADLWIKK